MFALDQAMGRGPLARSLLRSYAFFFSKMNFRVGSLEPTSFLSSFTTTGHNSYQPLVPAIDGCLPPNAYCNCVAIHFIRKPRDGPKGLFLKEFHFYLAKDFDDRRDQTGGLAGAQTSV